MRITAITHRHDPILTITNDGKPWDEYHVLASVGLSALLVDDLKKRGFEFTSLYIPPPQTAAIISVKPLYAGYTRTLANAVLSSETACWLPYLFIVGDDVDVTNSDEVLWCLTTRMHPIEGIHQVRNTPGNVLSPFLRPYERRDELPCIRAIFEAVFPAEWSKEQVPVIVDFEHAWPEDIQKRVLNRWREYGLEKV